MPSPASASGRSATHRNLVTERGLAQIEENLADLREILAKAERKADRERIAVVSRDLRYWTARRENAELSVPEPGSDLVRFGMGVTLEGDDGKKVHWKIVGEDEADPAKGSISHVSPMAGRPVRQEGRRRCHGQRQGMGNRQAVGGLAFDA